jgi:hypothetical protein
VTVPPSEKFARAKRIETFGETVWSEVPPVHHHPSRRSDELISFQQFTPLAQKYQAVQLGQGFPGTACLW